MRSLYSKLLLFLLLAEAVQSVTWQRYSLDVTAYISAGVREASVSNEVFCLAWVMMRGNSPAVACFKRSQKLCLGPLDSTVPLGSGVEEEQWICWSKYL